MMQTISAVLLLLLLSTTNANPTPLRVKARDDNPTADDACKTGKGLNAAAQKYGKYFGSATTASSFSDSDYCHVLDNWADFGQLTPAVGMKWADTEPTEGAFNATSGNAILNHARANGKILRCHALIWHQNLPEWLTNRQWARQELIDVLQQYIKVVMQSYRGSCSSWDVVNEALENDGSYRKTMFLDVIGPDYIAMAFKAAKQVDPNVALYYNDFNIENDYDFGPQAPSGSSSSGSSKRDVAKYPCGRPTKNKIEGVKCLVKNIRDQGGKIDGIGMQGHYPYNATVTAETLSRLMNGFTTLNLDVAITELDIRMDIDKINNETMALQAQGYANVVTACKNTPRCVGITIWEFADNFSWVPSLWSTMGSALPWDSNLKVKQQIYDAMMNAWCSAPPKPSGL